MSSLDWVTVLTVADEIDANLKKGLLEDAGIECVIESSPFRAYPIVNLNNFRLSVPRIKLQEAREVLNELENPN